VIRTALWGASAGEPTPIEENRMGNGIPSMAAMVAAVSVSIAAQQGSAPPPPQMSDHVAGYHLASSVPLPDQGGWDYLGIDEQNHHLFVSHGDEILVISTETNQLAGKLAPTPRSHGVVISEKDNHGFTSNSGNPSGPQGVSSFTEFDPKTLAIIKQVILPMGGSDGIVYDPASDRVFGLTHGKKDVAVDAATGEVAGIVDIPGAAESAAADGQGHLYNVMEDLSVLVAIDTHALKVVNQWPLAPCTGPSGVAMDTETRRIFIGCHGGGDHGSGLMVVFDPDAGKVVAALPIGGRGNDAVRFDPRAKLAFASEGEGDITIVREDSADKFTVLGNLKTESGARTMECDSSTHTLYSVTAKFGPPPAPEPGAPPARGGGRFRRGPMIAGSFKLLVIPDH
jgi:DNA-binding beta-propeller fold protein YncE